MNLYLGAVKLDQERRDVARFVELCREKGVNVQFSGQINPENEIEWLEKASIIIVILSKISMYSTWLLELIKLANKHKSAKLYFVNIDNVEIPSAFKNNLFSFKKIKSLNEETLEALLVNDITKNNG